MKITTQNIADPSDNMPRWSGLRLLSASPLMSVTTKMVGAKPNL